MALSKKYKFRLKLFAAFLLFCFIFAFIPQYYTQAVATTTIPKSKVHKIATFDNQMKNAMQGGVVTPKYYVYLDCTSHCSGKSYAVIVNRNNCNLVKRVKLAGRRLSGPSYKWGSNYVSLVNNGNTVGCVKLAGANSKYTSSGCFQPDGAVLSDGGTSQGAPANYNGYRFKVSGYSYAHIGVFKGGSHNIVKKFIIPSIKAEPEGISIDGATGEVYISYNKNHKTIFYKIDASVFKKYTGKNKTSNPTVCNNIGNASNSNSSASDNGSASGNKSGGTHTEKYVQPESPGYDGTVETTLFGTIQDDGEGCGTYEILNLIIQILTIGIGITATIGIVVEGIRYLTSKDNVAQATKAKRRIFDIFVGLAIYAVLWALLSFLLPGGTLNTSTTCERVDATTATTET